MTMSSRQSSMRERTHGATTRRTMGFALAVVAIACAAWWIWNRAVVDGRRSAATSVRFTPQVTADQNVLLITIDTLRADALRAYGGQAETPVLDALAADGIRYTFAHAHAVVTLPSHASILSGLLPFQHGVRDNSGFRLDRRTPTLATLLKQEGFATGAFIGAFPLDAQFGLDTGFDVYDDRLPEVRGAADFAMAERRAPDVVAPAVAWVQQQRGKWFAWVHVYDPHAPTSPPEPFASRYRESPYAGEVAFTDASLAPLLAYVRAQHARPTLIIVTADHGEALGDHGEETHGVFAYESTLAVPLIVAQVGGRTSLPTGVSDESVQHVDIAPTVLAALGIARPAAWQGRELSTIQPGRPVYFESLSTALNRGWAPLHGVLVDRDKFIDLPLAELYDLRQDPREQHNLLDTRGERRRALADVLNRFGPLAPRSRTAESSETTSRLQSLGYVSGGASVKTSFSVDDDPKRLIAIDRAIQQAIARFHQGQPREAADTMRRVIAQRPTMTLAYLHLAFLEWELGERDDAIATLKQAMAKAAPSAEVEARLGVYLAETGRAREAVPLLERAASAFPADADVANALAIAAAREGDVNRARKAFARLLEVDPRNAMAWQNIGSLELQARNLDAARRAFERALEINPAWAPAHTGLGALEATVGHRAAAIEHWSDAVRLDPSDFDALYNLGTHLAESGRMVDARPHLERFVREAPRAQYARDIDRLTQFLRQTTR